MARLINSCARDPHSGHAIGCVDDGPILGLRLRTEDVRMRPRGKVRAYLHTCYYFILDQSPVATGSLGECQTGWTEKGLSPFSRIENGAVGKFKIII